MKLFRSSPILEPGNFCKLPRAGGRGKRRLENESVDFLLMFWPDKPEGFLSKDTRARICTSLPVACLGGVTGPPVSPGLAE